MVSTKLVLLVLVQYTSTIIHKDDNVETGQTIQQWLIFANRRNCRKAYRTALKSGQDCEVIKQLSSQWFHLIRRHNQTRLKTLRRSSKQKARNQQIRCDKDFWKFVASVFHDDSSSNLTNSLTTVHDTELHFTKSYSSEPIQFYDPSFLPQVASPMHAFDDSDISIPDVQQSIRKSRLSSSSSPLDQNPLFSKSAHLFMLHCCLYFKNAGRGVVFLMIGKLEWSS